MKKIVLLNFLLICCFTIESKSQITFQKSITGEGYDSYGKAVIISNDGGFVTCTAIDYVSTASSGQVGLSLNKFDTNGILIWSKNISDSEKITPRDIKQTTTGGYIIAGETSNLGSNPSAYLLKTDSTGNYLWSKKFQTNSGHGYSVALSTDGGFVLTGRSIFGVYIVKTDSSGNHIWSKQINETISGIEMWGLSIDNTFDGGYIVGGIRSNAGISDFLLMKFDGAGNLLWTKTYHICNEWGFCVKETNDNGFVITGFVANCGEPKKILVIKTDSAGNPNWARSYGGIAQDSGEYIEQTSDGGYCIIGNTQSFGTSEEVYLIKIDFAGSVVWSKTYGGANSETGYCLKQTLDGGYILVGLTLSFSSLPGYRNTYFIKTDSLGNSLCYENDVVTVTDTLNPTTTSIFPSISVLGDGAFSTASYSGYLSDSTICYSVGVTENIKNNTFQIYPNPTSGTLYINNINSTYFIEVFDIYGKIIFTTNINKEHFEINLNNNSKGIYFYRATDENKKIQTGKFILN